MKLTKYVVGGLAALALVGCKDKMRELNTNPNTIGETDPRYIFMSVMQDFDYDSRGFGEALMFNTSLKMQYFVEYRGAADGTYCNVQSDSYTTPSTTDYMYNWLYSVGKQMAELQSYIDVNLTETEALPYQDLRAIAGIVKVFEAFRVFQNYGAAVYTEAFEANTGVLTPAYDIFDNAMYEALDDELAGYIAVLAGEPNAGTPNLGEYDPIYGYVANTTTAAPTLLGDYDQQRTKWKKFGNSYRLYMAWIMKAADPARFDKVLAETKASGWFETAADGAFAYMNSSSRNSGLIYNSDGPNGISISYALTDNFVTYLKKLDDPRLPLLARANDLYAANKDIQWIQAYFPDSLVEHSVYDKQTKAWSTKSWGDVLDFKADPMMAYQGVSANPYDYDEGGPEQFWGQRNFTFRFYHPSYKPGDVEANAKLGPWTVTNDGSIIPVSEDFPAIFTITASDTSFTLELGSRPQGRYFIADGGKEAGGDTGNGVNGGDGPVNQANKFYTHPVYTYPEFCFMMAYLSSDGIATGKSADDWYEAGVTAAMQELQNDAQRYAIQVATNRNDTKIVGVNDADLYDITDKIAPYVTAQALANATDKKEAIVGQMWIYAYNQANKMWDWWRVTGYPKIVEVATPADRPTGLYWVKPSTRTAGNPLEFPRRASLPQPNVLNNLNYNAARETLMNQPNYGSIYDQATGRIYWDVQGL